uniref:Uncharacterized protein n=1 Tax=Pyramimonas obovata TaxID=1411642 RepID=A0A7S0RIQ6_9CHLO
MARNIRRAGTGSHGRELARRLRELRVTKDQPVRYGSLANHGDLMFGKPSTGMALAFALKNMCKSVSVYGIGIHNAKGSPTAYKYYKVNNTTSPVASTTSGTLGSYTHSFEFELELMMAMDKDKLIKFCLYKPGDAANNDSCMHPSVKRG